MAEYVPGREFALRLDAADALDNILGRDGFDIHRGGIPQEPQHGAVLSIPGVDLHLVLLG